MAEPVFRLRRFLRELRRRKVYRVGAGYLVTAFIVLQMADLASGAFALPSWFEPLVWVLCGLGFPLALILGWALELTPEGVRRTSPVRSEGTASGRSDSPDAVRHAPEGGAEEPTLRPGATDVTDESRRKSRLALQTLVGLGLVAAAASGVWYLVGGGGEAAAPVGERSVAVLPFEPQGRDEPGPFTAGMHSALSSRLGNVSGLRVSPSRAVQGYRETSRSTGQIARELGVEWIVAGNVLETGDQIRVIVELVDPQTRAQRWSKEYRREISPDSLFDLQADIATEIAGSLETELRPEERRRVERAPTGNLEAYDLYVRGRTRLDQRTETSIREAIEFFQQAIGEDSTFTRAWAGLADARGLLVFQTATPETLADSIRSTLPAQEAAARRAVTIDSTVAEARASLGFVHFLKQEGPAALRELTTAIELSPSDAQAHHWLGALQLYLGRPGPAHRHLQRALDLNPHNRSAWDELAQAEIANGAYREALATLEEGRRRYPEGGSWEASEALALVHLGRWEDVSRWAHQVGSRDSAASLSHALLALADVAREDTASARARLDRLRETEPSLLLALGHAALGNPDTAITVLNENLEEAGRWHTWKLGSYFDWNVRYHFPHTFGPLRDDPLFQQLISRLNVAWGLEPDGSLPEGVDVSFAPESDE